MVVILAKKSLLLILNRDKFFDFALNWANSHMFDKCVNGKQLPLPFHYFFR